MKNVSNKLKKFPALCLSLLFCSTTMWAQQQRTVKGTILDDNGEPIIGASIIVKGNNQIGTISDIDGNFTLKVPEDNSLLVISFIGMQSQELRIPKNGVMKVVLSDNTELLDEVVIVGYGQQKKASVVGAITQTNAKVLGYWNVRVVCPTWVRH